jgi:hypothetical protein
MKRWFSSVAVSVCILLVVAGCHSGKKEAPKAMKETKAVAANEVQPKAPAAPMPVPVVPPTAAPAAKREGPPPQIKFEATTVDLGDIKPESKNVANYTFTNVGKGTLKIIDIVKTCGCTPFELAKREYAPGESGTIKVEYQATKAGGAVLKHLFVMSDDPDNPRQEITLKANVVLQVIIEPQTMQLSLEALDANAPEITLYSKDDKPFSIKSIESSNNTITAQIDPNASAAKFVLHLKVDKEKLKTNLNGYVKFNITHPDINVVSVSYTALAEFETQPSAIIIRNASPLKTEERELWVKNNYNKPFEIESITSKNGYIKAIAQEKVNELYKVKLAITPPESGKTMFFSDVVTVRIKNVNPLEVNCRGFYRR